MDRASRLKQKPKTESKSNSDLWLELKELKKQVEEEKVKHAREVSRLKEALNNQTKSQLPFTFFTQSDPRFGFGSVPALSKKDGPYFNFDSGSLEYNNPGVKK